MSDLRTRDPRVVNWAMAAVLVVAAVVTPFIGLAMALMSLAMFRGADRRLVWAAGVIAGVHAVWITLVYAGA